MNFEERSRLGFSREINFEDAPSRSRLSFSSKMNFEERSRLGFSREINFEDAPRGRGSASAESIFAPVRQLCHFS